MAVSAKLRAQILEEWPTCRICRRRRSTSIDHIWPRRYGGSDDRANLQAACHSCNSKKNGRLPPDGMLPLFGQLEKPKRGERRYWKPAPADWLRYFDHFARGLDLE